MKKLLIYGANGYTAQLIVELAVKSGLKPILAGRTAAKIQPIAEQYNLEYRIFDLKSPKTIDNAIADIKVVLHCAGPYVHTAKPMVEACIRNMAHYLDITGEIEVFEMLAEYDLQAEKAAITILPGCGFDVVPTDCLAKFLADKMPDATHLSLGFASKGGSLSHGTAMTMVENFGETGKVRIDSKIVDKPVGNKTQVLKFGDEFKSYGITIPWGDVSTAYYSTGIPNIEVFLGMKESQLKFVQFQSKLNWLMKLSFVKKIAKIIVDSQVTGPDEKARKKAKAYIWGSVKNKKGEIKTAYLVTPETYTLTALMAVNIAQKVINDNFKVGFQTPAKAYGSDLVMEIDGVKRNGK
jgi:short subunit dehydrogenase-like uncharacterized protein